MAAITFKGEQIQTSGTLPAKGSKAPDFKLTNSSLSDVKLADVGGSALVLNIFPSLDTSVCATTVRRFNEKAAELQNTKVLCISMDLPFAQDRFCETNGIQNVYTLSAFRSRSFGDDYGVRIMDGPLAELLARAIVVVDRDGFVCYTQLVPEIAQEPDYEEALQAIP